MNNGNPKVPTCKTCKHWRLRNYSRKEQFHVCERVDGTDSLTDDTTGNNFAMFVTVADSTDLNTDLKTGPDFGCVLHEEITT